MTSLMLLKLLFGFQAAMALYNIFDWFELTLIGTFIRDSVWLFPVIESFHLIGLAVLGGSVLIVDLRLLGLGVNQVSIPTVAKVCQPWFRFGIILMFSTGIPLFLSEATKCYYSPFFWIKMGALFFALVITFSLRRKIISKTDNVILRNWTTCSIGLLSMSSWFTVSAAGRWIGFY